jgi:hypothetical protein
VAPDPDPVAHTGVDPAAHRATTHAHAAASTSPDTATSRAPLGDDDSATPAASTAPPAAEAAADDLTIGADPLGARPEPEPRSASSAARDVPPAPPVEEPYGTPFGAPPPYATSSYAAEPYPSDPTTAPPATDRRKRRQHWAGAILIVLGLLFLGNNLGLLWWVEPEYLLPLILVGVGAWLLFGRGRRG